jgi:hypothetical protein
MYKCLRNGPLLKSKISIIATNQADTKNNKYSKNLIVHDFNL